MTEKNLDPQVTEQTDREEQLNLILRGENNEQKDTLGSGMNLRSIMGGDFLTHPFFRRQIKLFILIIVYTIFYIGNRYTVQQQLIEIDKLEKKLVDIKYNALTRSSELTEMSRQSRIEEFIRSYDSELETATNPPFLIKEPEE